MTKAIGARLIGAAIALAMAGGAAAAQTKDVKFTLDWALQGNHAVWTVAQEKGYFTKEGLNVKIDRGFGSGDAVTKVASGAYDLKGWQPEYTAMIPQMNVEMIVQMPFAKEYEKLAANPKGFPELARKLIALEKEPMAWESDVKAVKTPTLIIAGDADVATLEHTVQMFHLLGGGGMGDMMDPTKRATARLAIMPATAHTNTRPKRCWIFIRSANDSDELTV